MNDKDSIGYSELRWALRNNLGWLSLNDSEREVLALLLTEDHWSDAPQSPEDIADSTGLARSTISAIMSKLMGLGLIETVLDNPSSDTVGRRKTFYKVKRGLPGVILFGVRRIVVELNNLSVDLKNSMDHLERQDHIARDIIRTSLDNVHSILSVLTECSEKIPVDAKASTWKK